MQTSATLQGSQWQPADGEFRQLINLNSPPTLVENLSEIVNHKIIVEIRSFELEEFLTAND